MSEDDIRKIVRDEVGRMFDEPICCVSSIGSSVDFSKAAEPCKPKDHPAMIDLLRVMLQAKPQLYQDGDVYCCRVMADDGKVFVANGNLLSGAIQNAYRWLADKAIEAVSEPSEENQNADKLPAELEPPAESWRDRPSQL